MVAWNKGHNKETDERVRQSTINAGLSRRGKHYPKISAAKKGRTTVSESTREKISLSLKGRPKSEEWKKKVSLAKIGKPHSEEAKRNLSIARMGMTPWNKGKSDIYTPEQLQKISNTLKIRWQDPVYAMEQVKKQGRKPNNNELYLDAILQLNFPKEWKYVGDGQIWIAGRNPDFFNINGKKLLIELDGLHWHTNKQKDIERDTIYKRYGYATLSINENSLENEQMLIQLIKDFTKQVNDNVSEKAL